MCDDRHSRKERDAREASINLSIALAAVDAYIESVISAHTRLSAVSLLLAAVCEKELGRYSRALVQFRTGNRRAALRLVKKELKERLNAAEASGNARSYFQTAEGRRMAGLGADIETIQRYGAG